MNRRFLGFRVQLQSRIKETWCREYLTHANLSNNEPGVSRKIVTNLQTLIHIFVIGDKIIGYSSWLSIPERVVELLHAD